MDTSNWEFLQSFTPQFQAMRSEIESRLVAASSAVPETVSVDELNALSALLAKATKSIADAAGAIPSYDQKQYEGQLKALSKTLEELRSTSVPKSKFAFKRKVPASASTGSKTKTVPESPVSVVNSVAAATDSVESSTHLLLSGRTNQYLTRSDFPPHDEQTDLALENLTNCVVDLLPSMIHEEPGKGEVLNLTALHVRNLKNCVILLPHIAGSALLHDMERCVILLGSHQFRMHTSQRIDIFLSIVSNPIIEHCSGIRFTQYPAAFELVPKLLPMYTVQDFSHIRSTPSPNFSIMQDGEAETVQRALMAVMGDGAAQRLRQGDASTMTSLNLDVILPV